MKILVRCDGPIDAQAPFDCAGHQPRRCLNKNLGARSRVRVASVIRPMMFAATAFAGLALAGCGSSGSSGSGMMGASGASTASSNRAGRMSGEAGYHFARASCSPPRRLPGHVINVTLADMGMTQMMGGTAPTGAHMMLRLSATTVPAGQISLVASNVGWRTHELVILKLPAEAAAGRRAPASNGKVAETGSLGEASRSCGSGTGDGITSGSAGWTTLTLTPQDATN